MICNSKFDKKLLEYFFQIDWKMYLLDFIKYLTT